MSKEGEGGALVPQAELPDAQQSELMLKAMGFSGVSSLVLTSLDQSTDIGRITLFNLCNKSLPTLDLVIGSVIEIRDWLVTPVDLVSQETGEIRRCPLTRMIDANGGGFQTTAPAVLKALLQYHHHIRKAPWEPLARFVVRQYKSGSAKKYYVLELPEDYAKDTDNGKRRNSKASNG